MPAAPIIPENNQDSVAFAPYFLFREYFVQIAKYFKQIKSYRIDDIKTEVSDDGKTINNENYNQLRKLQVIYGTPRAAFRSFLKRHNGMMKLPVLNFVAIDLERRTDKEPTGARTFYVDKEKAVAHVQRPPMQFDLTYQFYLYTEGVKEREHVLYQIYTLFPRGEISLIYKDPTNPDNEDYIFMPLKLESNMADESELEGLDEKETRDVMRTQFTVHGQSIVPYPTREYPAIKSVYFIDTSKGESSDGNNVTEIGYDFVEETEDGHIVVDIADSVPTP